MKKMKKLYGRGAGYGSRLPGLIRGRSYEAN